MGICRGFLPWVFSVAFCRRNLPQLFTMGARCSFLPWLFTLEILLYVSKKNLNASRPFLYMGIFCFLFRKMYLLNVSVSFRYCRGSSGPPYITSFIEYTFIKKYMTQRTKALWQHVLVRINFLHFLYLKNFLAKYNLLQIFVSCSDLNSPREIIFYF